MGKKGRLSVSEMVLFAVLGALTFAMKVVMAPLPNIEPVSLSILLYASVFGLKGLYPTYLYVMLEILFYGLGSWNINYLYIWGLLALTACALRRMSGRIGWALLSSFFGLAFGALCAPVDVFIGGWSYAAAKWVSGIPFDIAHCAGNFVLALLLYPLLRELLTKLSRRIRR